MDKPGLPAPEKMNQLDSEKFLNKVKEIEEIKKSTHKKFEYIFDENKEYFDKLTGKFNYF